MLRACVYLAAMGKAGMRKVASLCWDNAHYAASRIAALPGFAAPEGLFFKEFLAKTPIPAERAREEALEARRRPGPASFPILSG